MRMTGDYAHDHPGASLPELRLDSKLTAEAHGLLDNGNNWREEMRNTATFTDGLLSIQDKTLDKNGDGIFSDGEMTTFVNDFGQSNAAREAVQLLREHSVLVKGKSSLAEIAHAVDQGLLQGADSETFKKDTLRKLDIENAKTTGAFLVAAAGFAGFASITMGPGGAILGGTFALGPVLTGSATYLGDHITGSRMIDQAIVASQVLQPLDLFDRHSGDLQSVGDFRQRQNKN